MSISVIICTYNRCASLKDLLECLLGQDPSTVPDHEIVIVDNNSKDSTKQLVDSYMPKFRGKLHFLFEPKQGKSHALNLGINHAKGDVLAFTDDDCFLEKSYLADIHQTLKEWGQDIGFMGGRISAKWTGGEPPEWLGQFYPVLKYQEIKWQGNDKPERLDEFFLGPIGILNYGQEPFVIDYNKNKRCDKLFYGANIIIRRGALEKCGYFDVTKILSQDSEICLRLLKGGVKGLYAPNIVVHHKISPDKITFDYYYQWYALRGKFDTPEVPVKAKFYQPLGVPLSMIRKTTSDFTKSCLAKAPHQKTFYRSNMVYNLGQIIQIAQKNIF